MKYLKHEKKSRKEFLKTWYSENRHLLSEETKNTPLREFTYENKRLLKDEEGNLYHEYQGPAIWVQLLDQYIRHYNVKIKKNATLEEVLKKL